MSRMFLEELPNESKPSGSNFHSPNATFDAYVTRGLDELYLFQPNQAAQQTVDDEFGSLLLVAD